MNYYVFLQYPWGEIRWAFIWCVPFIALARFAVLQLRRKHLQVLDEASYQMISAMFLLSGYLMAVSAYDPSHNIPDFGYPGFDHIPAVILFGLYIWCLSIIYRLDRSLTWKTILVTILTSLMYFLPSWIHVFHAQSNWG